MKTLKRSSNKVLFGVCSGVAEYLDLDPTVVRLLFAFAALWGGFGIFAYLVSILIIPKAN